MPINFISGVCNFRCSRIDENAMRLLFRIEYTTLESTILVNMCAWRGGGALLVAWAHVRNVVHTFNTYNGLKSFLQCYWMEILGTCTLVSTPKLLWSCYICFVLKQRVFGWYETFIFNPFLLDIVEEKII